jgi:hypothetical protein
MHQPSAGLALTGLCAVVATVAHAQLLTHRDLSYSIAKTIAETAVRCQGLSRFRCCRRSRRRHDRRFAQQQREPAHDGERASKGLHRQ